ncbi:MAG: 16S rRNA (cytosine(1402)-N(4))-methyltransferase RsmH [Anaerovoracaceae bacterium]|jgi:16S rRNA (cytosine1402-N4)-methyltransferase
MEFQHTSVLYLESISNLKIKPNGVYVDGTLGGGGHASGICEQLDKNGIFIGVDRDKDAIAASRKKLDKLECQKFFVQDNYSNIKSILNELGIPSINGAILDLGVSSFQLDNHERGFSYMQTAALDMRMNAGDPLTAEQVINEYSQKELTNIIKKYGEEKWASRISSFIVKEREKAPIKTTTELVEIIKAAIPAAARREGPHPAKRTFQAIRIEVNDELGQLEKAVDEFVDVLAEGGRLCIITFHSLEDRLVKDIFNRRANPCTCPKDLPICACGKKADIIKVSGKPIVPGEEELEENPRARSAKLRVIEKLLTNKES